MVLVTFMLFVYNVHSAEQTPWLLHAWDMHVPWYLHIALWYLQVMIFARKIHEHVMLLCCRHVAPWIHSHIHGVAMVYYSYFMHPNYDIYISWACFEISWWRSWFSHGDFWGFTGEGGGTIFFFFDILITMMLVGPNGTNRVCSISL